MIMNFTENCKEFMERWDKGKNERSRSYDYCKNLFDEYHQKPTLTNEEKDYFALNLFCYLASWGMLRGKGWLLSRSYKFFIPLCDVLFDKTYADLLNIDPLTKNYDCKMVMTLYNALKGEMKKVLQKDGIEREPSRLLLCKILMGTYGCVIAYDEYDQKGLNEVNVYTTNSSPLSEKLLQNTCKIITDRKDEFKKLMADVQAHYGVNYTAFKVLDMILWIEGEKSEKHKT